MFEYTVALCIENDIHGWTPEYDFNFALFNINLLENYKPVNWLD